MNKALKASLLLCFLVLGGLAMLFVASNTQAAETGVTHGYYTLSDDTMRVAISTYWPDVDSSEAVVSLRPLWGAPTGLITSTWYDNATDGQALVADAAGDRTYIDPDDYQVADLTDGQISIYRCELDGTTDAITTSVWSIDVFYWIWDEDWCGLQQ